MARGLCEEKRWKLLRLFYKVETYPKVETDDDDESIVDD